MPARGRRSGGAPRRRRWDEQWQASTTRGLNGRSEVVGAVGVAVIGDPDRREHVGPVQGRETVGPRIREENPEGPADPGPRRSEPGCLAAETCDRRNRRGHPERSRARRSTTGRARRVDGAEHPERPTKRLDPGTALPKATRHGVILDHTLDDAGEQPIYSTDQVRSKSYPLPPGEGARRAGEGLRLRVGKPPCSMDRGPGR